MPFLRALLFGVWFWLVVWAVMFGFGFITDLARGPGCDGCYHFD